MNLIVMAMKDEAIVLTAVVIRLSLPAKMTQTGTPASHKLLLTHAFTNAHVFTSFHMLLLTINFATKKSTFTSVASLLY